MKTTAKRTLTRLLLEEGGYTITGKVGHRVIVLRGYINRRETGYGVKQVQEIHSRNGNKGPTAAAPVDIGKAFETYEQALPELAKACEAALNAMDDISEGGLFHALGLRADSLLFDHEQSSQTREGE